MFACLPADCPGAPETSRRNALVALAEGSMLFDLSSLLSTVISTLFNFLKHIFDFGPNLIVYNCEERGKIVIDKLNNKRNLNNKLHDTRTYTRTKQS